MSSEPEKPNEPRDWVEDMEVVGHELVDRVKSLVAQGNVRRLIIRNAKGDALIELPLTPAVVVVGVAAVVNPVLAALGGLAALIARLKIEIVRVETIDDDADTIEISGDDVTNITPDE